MTNEEFLKHAEKYYDQKSFEYARKLIAVAEAAKTYFKKQHCTCLDGDECPECRENRERCENLLGKFK